MLFTNKRCDVIPAGVVERIMKEYRIKPVLEYQREGNLYLAELDDKFSSAGRGCIRKVHPVPRPVRP